jgi:hypothetical protein
MRQTIGFGVLPSRRRVAALALIVLAALAPVVSPAAPQRAVADAVPVERPAGPGYWMVASDGGVFSYGSARFFGSTGNIRLNQPIVGMAPTTTGLGYWMVATDGGIFSFGDATFHGSTGAIKLNRPIVGMAPTPSGRGYWLVASDGGIFSFGDARFFGSTGAVKLNKPIVGMAATPTGGGYWLVASDGGIFAFGDARFFGSTGAITLAKPITGLAATRSGEGYWMVASDGGVFAFGDAAFHGAGPQRPAATARSVVTVVPSPTGAGYWQAAASGELLAFGDAVSLGHPGSLSKPIVGMAAVPTRPGQLPDDVVVVPHGEGSGGSTTTTTEPDRRGPPEYFASAANLTWGTSISTVDPDNAGRVLALAEAGGKIFLAGEFAGAALPSEAHPDGDPNCKPGMPTPPPPASCVLRPFLFALDVKTGAILDWDAQPDGAVLSLHATPDGKGLYVGGRFTRIGGAPAERLALLDVETAQQVPTFKPPGVDSGVRAMALHGNTLYFGGSFRKLHVPGPDGRPVTIPQKAQVAAVDATTGALRAGFPTAENTGGRFLGHTGTPTEDGVPGVVYDMAVTADGKTLYVSGDFLHFGGQGGLLAIDTATGDPSAWQPAFEPPRPVFGVTVWPGDGVSLVAATGGRGGTAQFFTPSKGRSPVWIGRVDGDATDVVATTKRVYMVGHWDHGVPDKTDPCLRHVPVSCPDGTPHRKLIAYDARTGETDASFTAQANTDTGPYVALVGAHHLFVGGDFTRVGPAGRLRPQGGFAAFDQIAEPGPMPSTTTTRAPASSTTSTTSKRTTNTTSPPPTTSTTASTTTTTTAPPSSTTTTTVSVATEPPPPLGP